MVDELYQASWRPAPSESPPPFGNTLPPAPAPAPSVESYKATKPTPSKPAGAYRPPGARGTSTPSIFKREDEGGTPNLDGLTASRNGSQLNLARQSSPTPNGHSHALQAGGRGIRGRIVPGAGPPGWAPQEEAKKPKKKAKKKEGEDLDGSSAVKLTGGLVAQAVADAPRTSAPIPAPKVIPPPSLDLNSSKGDFAFSSSMPTPNESGATGGGPVEGLDPVQKKVRNLTKKLKAIDELKDKRRRGEKLETTQLKKIEGEADIRKELAALQI